MLQITQARVNNKLTTENSFLFSCYVDLIAKEETFVQYTFKVKIIIEISLVFKNTKHYINTIFLLLNSSARIYTLKNPFGLSHLALQVSILQLWQMAQVYYFYRNHIFQNLLVTFVIKYCYLCTKVNRRNCIKYQKQLNETFRICNTRKKRTTGIPFHHTNKIQPFPCC